MPTPLSSDGVCLHPFYFFHMKTFDHVGRLSLLNNLELSMSAYYNEGAAKTTFISTRHARRRLRVLLGGCTGYMGRVLWEYFTYKGFDVIPVARQRAGVLDPSSVIEYVNRGRSSPFAAFPSVSSPLSCPILLDMLDITMLVFSFAFLRHRYHPVIYAPSYLSTLFVPI